MSGAGKNSKVRNGSGRSRMVGNGPEQVERIPEAPAQLELYAAVEIGGAVRPRNGVSSWHN